MVKPKITALGSSFAAGPGIAPIENGAAGRSQQNYAHQLAKRLDADLTDLTVSGATLLNVLNEQQHTASHTFAPQLDGLPPDSDIVTLTCGGNDIGYIGCLFNDSIMAYLDQPEEATSNQPTAPFLDLCQLTDRFLAVLDKIHNIAPEAKVYLVEYLTLIGSTTRPWKDVPLTSKQMRHYQEVTSLLSDAYSGASKVRAFAEVVPVARASRDHDLGSSVPWVNGFNMSMVLHGPAPYHPNLAGHTAIAEMLYRRIRNQ